MTATTKRSSGRINLRRRVLGAFILLLLISASLVLLIPNLTEADPAALSGRLLVWHAFTGAEAEAFDEALGRFQALHTDVTIHHQAFDSRSEMRAQFEASASSGLGPDLLIGQPAWVRPLASSGAIRSITGDISDDVRDRFMPAALASLTYQDQLYGLPLSLEVPALYFNRRFVDSPAATLDELLAQAAVGNTVLMSTEFTDAFWGVQAFGGRLFNEEGRVILDQGGYANWLDWLRTARDAPGMILDNNRETLRERFLQGNAAYYVGYPSELNQIIETLGEENIGVTRLPSGPTGSAGPFLDLNAILFSSLSSSNQQVIGLELAKFLTNSEQNAVLMRRGHMIPANRRVRINPRLHPLVAGFAEQAASAVPLPNSERMDAVWANAGDPYNRALEGIITPLEAAATTTRAINEANGFAVADVEPPACADLGTIRLVHDLEGPAADALSAIIARYKTVCPLVIVQSSRENLELVRSRWARDPIATTNPDMVLASQTWLVGAVAEGITFRDLSGLVSTEVLQRFNPAAAGSMRVQNRLVGLPMTMHVHALYFNRSLVESPAPLLERLRSQADEGIPIALPASFIPAYWGIGAMGGALFDSDNRVVLDEAGFASWLDWLRRSRDDHGIQLMFSQSEAKSLFLAGSSAYYVGLPEERPELLSALGEDTVHLALLPAGPQGNATPLFEAAGFYINDAAAGNRANIAASFAAFATNTDNQTLLLETTALVPANATVPLDGHPGIATFVEQARSAYPVPNVPELRAVLTLGDQAYIAVLEEGVDPVEAAAALTRQINEANGFVDEAPAETPASTPEPQPEAEDAVPAASTQPAEPVQNENP